MGQAVSSLWRASRQVVSLPSKTQCSKQVSSHVKGAPSCLCSSTKRALSSGNSLKFFDITFLAKGARSSLRSRMTSLTLSSWISLFSRLPRLKTLPSMKMSSGVCRSVWATWRTKSVRPCLTSPALPWQISASKLSSRGSGNDSPQALDGLKLEMVWRLLVKAVGLGSLSAPNMGSSWSSSWSRSSKARSNINNQYRREWAIKDCIQHHGHLSTGTKSICC